MSAYLIVRLDIKDEDKIAKYREVTPAILKKYKGKFIARDSNVVTLEGNIESRRVVIIEFPSMIEAKGFYNSSEYQEAIKLREGRAKVEFIAVEGV
jgi:uncharacterized protein (DUF1330 family)